MIFYFAREMAILHALFNLFLYALWLCDLFKLLILWFVDAQLFTFLIWICIYQYNDMSFTIDFSTKSFLCHLMRINLFISRSEYVFFIFASQLFVMSFCDCMTLYWHFWYHDAPTTCLFVYARWFVMSFCNCMTLYAWSFSYHFNIEVTLCDLWFSL